jgi:predicted oxidoreductase (fatty acid repression mutant protein)
MEKEHGEKVRNKMQQNDKEVKRNINKVIKVPSAYNDEDDKTIVVPDSNLRKVSKKFKQSDSNIPKSLDSSRFQKSGDVNSNPHSSRLLRAIENRDKRLYNSWECGLHKYQLEPESDPDDEPMAFRFKLKENIEDKPKKRRAKTPPKSPFRGTILAEMENRRAGKIRASREFSSNGGSVFGKPASDDADDKNSVIQSVQRYNLPKDNSVVDKPRPAQVRRELSELGEKGSQIFMKKNNKDKIRRPFLPVMEDKPQLAHGRTVLRNPLAPVSLEQRMKPVVVLRSKLDDYSDAIREFLECIIDEQKNSFGERIPATLSQSTENMVIYRDIDEIENMKEMARAMKLGLSTLTNNTNKSLPNFRSHGLAKGTTRIRKIGALDSGLDGYRYRTPKKMSVGGQSIFLTDPNQTEIDTVMDENHYLALTSEIIGTDPKEKFMYLTGNRSKTTMAPPNTPHERQIAALTADMD